MDKNSVKLNPKEVAGAKMLGFKYSRKQVLLGREVPPMFKIILILAEHALTLFL